MTVVFFIIIMRQGPTTSFHDSEGLTLISSAPWDLRLWPGRARRIEHGLEVMVMSTSFLPRRSQSAVQTRVGSSLVLRVTLVILELFVGIGGIFGGLEMIRDPLNPLGMTTELIAGSPFDTYT